jgi:hypothetical protein
LWRGPEVNGRAQSACMTSIPFGQDERHWLMRTELPSPSGQEGAVSVVE